MLRIKKNDTVKVIAGKDKGKSGKVIHVYPDLSRALVQGVNYVKKHKKKTRQDEQGGIIQKEVPIHISNLQIICKGCNRPARIGVEILKDGSKTRFCKKCNEVL